MSTLIGHWRPSPSLTGEANVQVAIEAHQSLSSTLSGPRERVDLLHLTVWRYDAPGYIDNLYHLFARQSSAGYTHLGVSDFDLAHLKLVVGSGFALASNRVSASVLDRRFEELLPWCREKGVAVLGYGVTLGGFISEQWVGKDEPSDRQVASVSRGDGGEGDEEGDPRKWKRYIDAAGGWALFQDLLATLEGVARKHSVSLASVAAAWVLNAGVAAIFSPEPVSPVILDDADRAAIAGTQAALTPLPGGCGDELRFSPFLTSSGSLPAQALTSWEMRARQADIERVIANGGRVEYLSGSPWEPVVGYCRSVRYRDRIVVSGTTTKPHPSGTGVIGASAEDQATFVFDIIRGAICSLGGSMGDVVRTRILYSDVERDWLAVGRVQEREIMRRHGVLPTNTMVGGLTYVVGTGAVLEIEAECVMGAGDGEVLRLDPRDL